MVEGFQTFELKDQRWQASWHAEDFFGANDAASTPLFDPWLPIAISLQSNTVEKKTSEVIRPTDPWGSVEFEDFLFNFSGSRSDPWIETARLPFFDPQARRSAWSRNLFEGRFSRNAKSKAAWIVATLQPVTARERNACRLFFEDLFSEKETTRFFDKIRALAAQVDSQDSLIAAIQIRDLIEDSPEYRQTRVPGRYGIRYTQGPNLTWSAALRLTEARADFDPSEMIETEWLTDWRKLRPYSEGYFSFLVYACHRAEHERFEDWDVPKSVHAEESRWLSKRTTPVDDLSGISVAIRNSPPSVPKEVAKRFLEWREEIARKSTPVTLHSISEHSVAAGADEDCRLAEAEAENIISSLLPPAATTPPDIYEQPQSP